MMNNYIHPLQQHYQNQSPKQVKKPPTQFKDILSQVDTVKISKHAEMRLKERKIDINKDTWEEIGYKMNEAKLKGVTDALIVLDDAALVVSTKNNTVVTALNNNEATNKIFTNINGTILI